VISALYHLALHNKVGCRRRRCFPRDPHHLWAHGDDREGVYDKCTGNTTTIDGTPAANLLQMFSPAWQDAGCQLAAVIGIPLGSDLDLNTLSNLCDLKAMTRRSYFVIFSSRRTRG
jgi:hypothetical protein